MTDHEPFLVFASRQLYESLSDEEARELERHLAECLACRRQVAGMRGDHVGLAVLLADGPVAARVRRNVLDAAAGHRRTDVRVLLAVAALLVLGALGVPSLVGNLSRPPAVVPSPMDTRSTEPTATLTPSASPATATQGSVNGAYSYTVGPGSTRRDSVTASLGADPLGEWSRMSPATGGGNAFGGPVTCLVIDGTAAWLAGPATMATDGSSDRSAYIYVVDGGPGGEGDAAILWMNDPGQTLSTMEGWCSSRFIPGDPFPLDDGDVMVAAPEESP